MSNKKILVKFFLDCGRQGEIESLFISTEDEMNSIMGKSMSFYEVVGKHSQVFDVASWANFSIISDDPLKVQMMEETMGTHISGIDIFEHLD